MKIARFRSGAGSERLGVVVQYAGREMLLDAINAAASRGGAAPATALQVVQGGPQALDPLRALVAWVQDRGDPRWYADPDAVCWLTPVPVPWMICAGRNYAAHRSESARAQARPHGAFPTGFVKLGRHVVPHRARVARPPDVRQFDYEVEIALVLGPPGAGQAAGAPPSIFGYTIFNDLSARDWQLLEMEQGLLFLGKNFPGFGPLGPCILTADDVPDPGRMSLWLEVNGERRQQGDTSDLIFDFNELVAFWSKAGLCAGDVIATGTPAGVALHRKPDPTPFFLKPGDVVRAGVDTIGVLETTIV